MIIGGWSLQLEGPASKVPSDSGGYMYFSSRSSLIASLTKHDIAGIVIAVVAVALIVAGGAKLATKAVKGVLALMVLGVLAAVVAVLLLTRAI
jgi:hypothetical protein